MVKFKFGHDTNGNKVVKVTKVGVRGFSIQTLGNLPQTHAMRNGITDTNIVHDELRAFCGCYGTKRQQGILA